MSLANDPLDAIEDADALLIVTEWEQFRHIDWAEVRERMRRPWVYDGRNICDPARMAALGFVYRGIGKPTERIAATAGEQHQGRSVARAATTDSSVSPLFSEITAEPRLAAKS